ALDARGRDGLEARHAVGPRVVLRQRYRSQVAVDEGNVSFRPGVLRGEDAVGAAAAAQVEDALARCNRDGFHQGPRSVVEAPIREDAWPREEATRWAARNAHLERHLVAAPWPFTVAVRGEDRIAAGKVGVDAAEDLLQQGGEERVHLVRRPDEQLPVR